LKWFSSNWEVLVQMSRNLYAYVLVCEQCIQWLHQNVVIFLCQDCVSILWVYAKFQQFLGTFAFYSILFHMNIEFKGEIMHTNTCIFEQTPGIGLYVQRGS
jgi:hypothetical protein